MARAIPGEKIFKRLSATLKKRHKGQILAIDPKSGRYLLGKDELVVALKARAKYPGTRFSVFRVGHPTVHKFRKMKPPCGLLRGGFIFRKGGSLLRDKRHFGISKAQLRNGHVISYFRMGSVLIGCEITRGQGGQAGVFPTLQIRRLGASPSPS